MACLKDYLFLAWFVVAKIKNVSFSKENVK